MQVVQQGSIDSEIISLEGWTQLMTPPIVWFIHSPCISSFLFICAYLGSDEPCHPNSITSGGATTVAGHGTGRYCLRPYCASRLIGT